MTRAPLVDTIRCVYCKEVKAAPSKGEHIILDGLGGRATTRLVCSECNQFFGNTLDREFLRSGTVGLARLFDPQFTDGAAAGGQFLPTEFGFADIRLFNSGHYDLLPHVAMLGTRIVVMASDPDQPLTDQFLATFDRDAFPVRWDIRDRKEHVPPRITIDRTGRSHLLRARSSAEAEALLAVLGKGFKPGPYADWEPKENRIDYRSSLDVNVPGRCAAKMAFNLATAVLGADVMLRDDFDPVRAYIRGEDVIEGTAVGENGDVGGRIDYRFVDPWMNRTKVEHTTDSRRHEIILEVVKSKLCAHVLLFGGIERFRLRLGPLSEGTDEPAMIFALSCRPDADWWIPGEGLPYRHGEGFPG